MRLSDNVKKNMEYYRLVVSLTTYGKRINTVHRVIESLLNQTHQPDHIVLWLDQDEFTEDNIPNSLKSLLSNKFSIRVCANYRSFTKLVPTLMAELGEQVITVDDDIIYPSDMVASLSDLAKKHTNSVICGRARVIRKKADGTFVPYPSWKVTQAPGVLIAPKCFLPLGYTGVLYPAQRLDKEIINADAFQTLAPSADDIWFKCMSVLSGLGSVVMPEALTAKQTTIPGTQDIALSNTVNLNNVNGEIFEAVLKAYPKINNLLQREDYKDVKMDDDLLCELLDRQDYDVRQTKSPEKLLQIADIVKGCSPQLALSLNKSAKRLTQK